MTATEPKCHPIPGTPAGFREGPRRSCRQKRTLLVSGEIRNEPYSFLTDAYGPPTSPPRSGREPLAPRRGSAGVDPALPAHELYPEAAAAFRRPPGCPGRRAATGRQVDPDLEDP